MGELQYKEHGIVKASAGCITTVVGLQKCFLGQLVKFGYETEGVIMGFDLESAQVLVVKENEPITPGHQVTATLEQFNMPVGDQTIGRVFNPLGEPADGLPAYEVQDYIPYYNEVPAIMDRKPLSRTMETGLKMVDTMLPLGKGQRSLILGDKMSGKTTAGTDIILNQKGKGVICIYCAIGKPRSALNKVVDLFKEKGCFEYTVMLIAPASTSPGLQYLAPYAACSVGDYFMYRGKDVFVLFDDFTKHAWAYRELSLLMQVPPGRDSYPGDIFYLHSRMIERAAQLNDKLGGGSMTFIPIVELLEGDLTAYVPTNLVSMTDGQIFLNMALFNEGFRPAVDVGLSVSRVGSKVQWNAMQEVSNSLRLEFIEFKELLRISKLQTGGQSDEVRDQLSSGQVLQALLTQGPNEPVTLESEILIFFGKNENLYKGFNKDQAIAFQKGLTEFALKTDPGLYPLMRQKMKLDDEIKQRMRNLITEYVKVIKATVRTEEDDETVETASS